MFVHSSFAEMDFLVRWGSIVFAASSLGKVVDCTDCKQHTVRCSLSMVLVHYPSRLSSTPLLVADRSISLSSRCDWTCVRSEPHWASLWLGMECVPNHGTSLF